MTCVVIEKRAEYTRTYFEKKTFYLMSVTREINLYRY